MNRSRFNSPRITSFSAPVGHCSLSYTFIIAKRALSHPSLRSYFRPRPSELLVSYPFPSTKTISIATSGIAGASSIGHSYDVPPAAFFADRELPLVMQEILDNVGYPHLPTIYSPALQCLFGLSGLLAPGNLYPLKFLLIAVDLSLIAVM